MTDDSSAGYSWWSGAVNETWRRKGTDVYVVPTSSFVGIGTTAPETELEVEGTITADRVLGVDWPDIRNKPVAEQTWLRNGDALYNANPGNVGIGTSAPQHKVHVSLDKVNRQETFPSGVILKPFPPPSVSWTDPNSFTSPGMKGYYNLAAPLQTGVGQYAAGTYSIATNVAAAAGSMLDLFKTTQSDYISLKKLDHGTNNSGGVQAVAGVIPVKVWFSAPEAFQLKKYLIQASWLTLGNPYSWELYGHSGTYNSTQLPNLTGGTLLHKVSMDSAQYGANFSTEYDDIPFGIYTTRMQLDVVPRIIWQKKGEWINSYVSRLYTPTITNQAFATYEFRFNYVYNVEFRTYIDRDGFPQEPAFKSEPNKVFHKSIDENGDVWEYGVSLSHIRFFTEVDTGVMSLINEDKSRSVISHNLFGYEMDRLKKWTNLWFKNSPIHVLDTALFDAYQNYGTFIPTSDVTFTANPKRYTLATASSLTMPVTTLPDAGFYFLIDFTPSSTGRVFTMKTEWDPTHYFDGDFKWADDVNYNGNYTFKTFRSNDGSDEGNWNSKPDYAYEMLPKMKTPPAFNNITMEVKQDGTSYTFSIKWYLFNSKSGQSAAAAGTTPLSYEIQYNVSLNNRYTFLIDFATTSTSLYVKNDISFQLTKQVKTPSLVTNLFKLCNIGKSGLNNGASMDLSVFSLFNGNTKYTDRELIFDILTTGQTEGFDAMREQSISQTFKLPLMEYTAQDGYTLSFDGLIKGGLSLTTATVGKLNVGNLGDTRGKLQSLEYDTTNTQLIVEGDAVLGSSLNVGGNVQVAGSITPLGAVSDLGTASAPFRELFLSGNTLHLGGVGVGKSGEGLALTYGAGNADLTLRALTAASVYATTYFNLPETTWDDVIGKPSVFPSTWDLVSDKPTVFPSEWSIVANKPSVFPSEWSIVANKPELVLCEEDLKVQVPVGSIVAHIGNEYITDPTFDNVLGKTVNRDDYIELANALGIPKSQPTFRVASKSGWNYQGDYIQVGDDIVPSLYESGGSLERAIPIVTATNTPLLNGLSLWMHANNTSSNGLAWTIGGKTSFGIQSILSPEGNRTAFIENLYPKTTGTDERLTIQHVSGNVGIGSTQPAYKLDVNGEVRATRVLGVSYADLTDKPSIPSAQVNADWNATSGVAEILNKPRFPDTTQVNADWNATSGKALILNKPSISQWTTNGTNISYTGSVTVVGDLTGNELYTNSWFRNNNADSGLYNQVRGAHFVANNTAYGNWKMYGNQVNGWSGINFSDQTVSLMMNDGTQGFHHNTRSWAMYHSWGTGIWSQTYGWLHDRFASTTTGGVGSYALLGYITKGTVAEGTILPGSALRWANTYHNGNEAGWRNSSPGGSWKLMGAIGSYINSSGYYAAGFNNNTMTSLFVRTS